MGIFSKSKSNSNASASEETLLRFISKFQQMIPDDLSLEINGKIISSKDLKDIVAKLARISNELDDQQLLHHLTRACLVSSEQLVGDFEVEKIAQTLFDDLGVSGEIRKRYSSNQSVVDAVATIGIASILILEKNPKFPEVMEYISTIAKNRVRERK